MATWMIMQRGSPSNALRWRHQIKISRSASRSSLDPTFRYNDYGFRVALSID